MEEKQIENKPEIKPEIKPIQPINPAQIKPIPEPIQVTTFLKPLSEPVKIIPLQPDPNAKPTPIKITDLPNPLTMSVQIDSEEVVLPDEEYDTDERNEIDRIVEGFHDAMDNKIYEEIHNQEKGFLTSCNEKMEEMDKQCEKSIKFLDELYEKFKKEAEESGMSYEAVQEAWKEAVKEMKETCKKSKKEIQEIHDGVSGGRRLRDKEIKSPSDLIQVDSEGEEYIDFEEYVYYFDTSSSSSSEEEKEIKEEKETPKQIAIVGDDGVARILTEEEKRVYLEKNAIEYIREEVKAVPKYNCSYASDSLTICFPTSINPLIEEPYETFVKNIEPNRYVLIYFYPDLKILHDKRNGLYKAQYIVDELIKQEGRDPKKNKKEANKWFANKQTQQMIESFTNFVHAEEGFLVLQIHDTIPELRGYWIHELLVDHLAIWASHKFAWKITIILKKLREQQLEKVCADMKQMEDQYKTDIDFERSRLDIYASTNELLNNEVRSLKDDKNKMDAAIDEMKEEKDKLEETINQLNYEVQSEHYEKERFERMVEDKNYMLSMERALKIELEKNIEELRKEVLNTQVALQNAQTERQHLAVRVGELNEEIHTLTRQNDRQQTRIEENEIRADNGPGPIFIYTWNDNEHAVYYITIRQGYVPRDVTQFETYFHAQYPAPMEIKKELRTYTDGNNLPLVQRYGFITNINAVINLLTDYYRPQRIIIDPRNPHDE